MAKFIITQQRVSQFQAEVEADNEDEVWEAIQDGDVEFEFLQSDDEFEVIPKDE